MSSLKLPHQMDVVYGLQELAEKSSRRFDHLVVSVNGKNSVSSNFMQQLEVLLPKITEETDEAAPEKYHKVIILLSGDCG